MSAFIGRVAGPHHNSPTTFAEIWASLGGAELHVSKTPGTLDPTAARILAALLVLAADECERMRAKRSDEAMTEQLADAVSAERRRCEDAVASVDDGAMSIVRALAAIRKLAP